jgi:uncharacterized protein YqiB (DUF1249 family)
MRQAPSLYYRNVAVYDLLEKYIKQKFQQNKLKQYIQSWIEYRVQDKLKEMKSFLCPDDER